MIWETIVSTINPLGRPNFAPMGVITEDVSSIEVGSDVSLRLYHGSRTWKNLLESGEGVINFINDVLVFAATALEDFCPEFEPSLKVQAPGIKGAAARWEFVVKGQEEDPGLKVTWITAEVVHIRQNGVLWGFCRAQWAVLEAVIAATRCRQLESHILTSRWAYWSEVVEKTGGPREKQALNLVESYLRNSGFSIPVPGRKDKFCV